MSKGKLADKAGCGADGPLATAAKALRAGGPERRRQGPATRHDRTSGSSRSALRGSERLELARPPPPAASLGHRRCHPPRPTPPPTFTSEPSGNATATDASAAPRQQRPSHRAASHRHRGARPLDGRRAMPDAHWSAALPLPLAHLLILIGLRKPGGVVCTFPGPLT